MQLIENFPLKAYNTFGIECNARWFAEYTSAKDLREITRTDVYASSSSLLIGRGSNLLFLNDFPGLVLHSAICPIRVIERDASSVVLEVGSGTVWDDLVKYTVANGWWGLENLSLIPGETGAAAVQNIGAYGVELCDLLESVTALNLHTGQEVVLSVDDCGFGYRSSVFKTSARNVFAILFVRMRLSRFPSPCFSYPHLEQEVLRRGKPTLENIRNTIIAIRTAKLPDPTLMGNAGSFFMNPVIQASQWELLGLQFPEMPHYKLSAGEVKIPAAWLIEQCGWKGKSLGNAGVYEHQPLVLVNRGNATGQEIALLAAEIQQSVKERFGISLVPEVNFIH